MASRNQKILFPNRTRLLIRSTCTVNKCFLGFEIKIYDVLHARLMGLTPFTSSDICSCRSDIVPEEVF